MALFATADHRWIAALAWMGVTLAIDSVDGSLARACRVKQVLPGFDGALLDNIVDYFNYVIVPAFFLYESELVPLGYGLVPVLLMTVASGYQFCQSDAKTPDNYFKGFPSHWNTVVFYQFMLPFSKWINLAMILALAVAVFIPVRYLYPSRTPFLRPLTVTLSLLWGGLLLLALIWYPEGHQGPVYISLVYVFYYIVLSLYLTARGDSQNA